MKVDLAALPSPGERRLAVRVTKDALRQMRGGHPWVYDESITSASDDGAAGDLAVVFDDRRRFAGIGLWDPHSPIRLKVLHAGSPVPIDAAFWRGRIAGALAKRQSLVDDPRTDGYRLVHGENDGLPGLAIDVYDRTAVVKLYTTAWVPHLRDVVPVLVEQLAPSSMVLRLARNLPAGGLHGLREGDVLAGAPVTEPVLFRENGLVFESYPMSGQKTGHFLDQRDNRALVGDLAAGSSVLDVFSCTGGFSVHAAAGGATSVHSVDIATRALASAERNMAHNAHIVEVAACEHRTTAGDAFEVMADLAAGGETYGIVVVDPPSFAGRQEDVGRARQAYRRLTRLGLDLLPRGGILVQASCSSRVTPDQFYADVHEAVSAAGRRVADIDRTGHAPDHPIGFPQGVYLKALFTRVDP